MRLHTRSGAPSSRRGVSQREEEILTAVYTYRYLTVDQVTRLFFAPTSRNYAGEYLRRLTKETYIERFGLPAARPGNPQLVHALSVKGIRLLSDLGMELYSIPRAPQAPSFQHINHTLGVNDVLIAAATITKAHPAITLAEMRPEWMFKHTPLIAEQVQVVPDGWLDFRLPVAGKRVQFPLLLELDRGSEDQVQLRRKCKNLLTAVLSPGYASLFGTPQVTIAFACTTGEKRAVMVKQWIEKELTEHHLTQEADLFFIADISRWKNDPAMLFLDPIWMCPFRQDRSPLLPS
jgi:hypothetical protein